MKNSIIMAVLFCSIAIFSKAQNLNPTKSKKAVTSAESGSHTLLTAYLDIKDAFVKSDAKSVSVKAERFQTTVKDLNVLLFSKNEKAAFLLFKDELIASAEKMQLSKSIEDQRNYFASFSMLMSKLASELDLGNMRVYQQFCPMKKAYWLSENKVINNPYYGEQMLTCGKISATIN